MSEVQLNLKMNDLYVETVYKGEPLVFTLQLSYPGNMEDEQDNRVIELELEDLKERLNEGETTEEEMSVRTAPPEGRRVGRQEGINWYRARCGRICCVFRGPIDKT